MKSLYFARQRLARLSLTTATSTTAIYRAAALASQRSLRVQKALPSQILARYQSTAAAQSIKKPAVNEEDDVEKDNDDPAAPHTPFSAIRADLSPNTYRAITVEPFQHQNMTPVQHSVLHHLPELVEEHDPEKNHRRDLLVKAKTGTGKTLAFLVPAIEARRKRVEKVGQEVAQKSGAKFSSPVVQQAMRSFADKNVGTLIISPTRELAIQIAVEAEKLSWHHRMDVGVFVGGESKGPQLRHFWKSRKDIIVATPGRLYDMLSSVPSLSETFENLNTLVLDEADTLLDMGFRADIERIIDLLPKGPERQTFLFSATVSPAIKQVAELSLQRNHRFINCVREDDSPVHAHIPQYLTVLPSPEEQIKHVTELLAHDQLLHPGNSKVMLFFNTTRAVQLWSAMLGRIKESLPAGRDTQVFELHSRKSMEQRRRTSDRFRATKDGSSILVTTDVSARGVDYPGVTRVIQVGIPASPPQYIHRVGRTGRGTNRVGRGDFVLLPFERDFPGRELREVPLKKLEHGELGSELNAMAEQYEVDPRGYAKEKNPSSNSIRPTFGKGVSNRLSSINETLEFIRSKHEPDQIEDVFTAELGYYAGQMGNLRLHSSQVLDGVKDWFQGAFGSQPPHLSPAFLAKIGFKEKVPGRFGSTRNTTDRRRAQQAHVSKFERGFNDTRGSRYDRSRPNKLGNERFGGSERSGSGKFGGDRFGGSSSSDRRRPKFSQW